MQTLPPNVQLRRLLASLSVSLVAVLVCGCLLLLAATASAIGTLTFPLLHAEAKSADALIVVNEGIGPVHIGQTFKQVQQEAGKPTSKSAAAMSWYYDNKPPYAQVGFGKNKRVNLISPNSVRDKTSKGIGEDSSEAQVQAAYPNARCGPQPGPGSVTDLSCEITKHLPGGTTIVTSFTFSTADGSGGVNSVYISEF